MYFCFCACSVRIISERCRKASARKVPACANALLYTKLCGTSHPTSGHRGTPITGVGGPFRALSVLSSVVTVLPRTDFANSDPADASGSLLAAMILTYIRTNSIRFFRINSPERACRLMDSNIWGVLARRIGNEAFLRQVFPLLLAWLERGVEDPDADVRLGNTNHRCCAVQAAAPLRQAEETTSGGTSQNTQQVRSGDETRPATTVTVSSRSDTSGVVTPTNGSVGRADRAPSPENRDAFQGLEIGGGGGVEVTRMDGADSAASGVQVAAAASISLEVFECLGKKDNCATTGAGSGKKRQGVEIPDDCHNPLLFLL